MVIRIGNADELLHAFAFVIPATYQSWLLYSPKPSRIRTFDEWFNMMRESHGLQVIDTKTGDDRFDSLRSDPEFMNAVIMGIGDYGCKQYERWM